MEFGDLGTGFSRVVRVCYIQTYSAAECCTYLIEDCHCLVKQTDGSIVCMCFVDYRVYVIIHVG